ncbi:MAG: energy-coupling factor transporter transmembrane protein EcfT [Clostridiales Family XIII bacterium]|jgi:energy-coupling factor transport system permease protein|nr:energy-coupling factor transporter transmembrane protein EcfT [Clostridiales Family XIII bacterium]
MRDTFSGFHPAVNMLFFTGTIIFSMSLIHPVCLAISLTCAFAYSIYINGKKALRWGAMFMLPMLIATALINPAFNHQGATILAYLRSGNPLTLESILYGIAAAAMLITAISWFSCFNAVMTSDKFIYLFGRAIPGLSLILSMSLRFVPRFKAQIAAISGAQRCIGRDASDGGLLQRARHGIRIVSIMVTWALENAIETADSMKGRGYGLPGRTAFSIFALTRRDLYALAFIGACCAYIALGAALGGLRFRYFPTVRGEWAGFYTISLFMAYLALCLSPLAINIMGDIKWKAIESKI